MTGPLAGSPGARASAMRRDIASAYLASGARILSWVIVSGLVYRLLGPNEFAMLALVRGTIGLLNYTSFGLAPALIHRASQASQDGSPQSSLVALYSNAQTVAMVSGIAGLALTAGYAWSFNSLYRVPPELTGQMSAIVLFIGIGVLMRLTSDGAGAILQVRDRIFLDNALVAAGDFVWVVLTAMAVFALRHSLQPPQLLSLTALAYGASGVLVFVGRLRMAAKETGVVDPKWDLVRWSIVRSLLAFGLLVTLAQLADYLYAPTDYILIAKLLSPVDVANYAPAVQIDSGLLLLVTGLSAVLLPKAALAHAGGSIRTVRAYYIRGTLASLGLLAAAAIAVWLASPWLFRLWLGNPMPVTQMILPLVLTHTVLGGSSAVGRSILLAVGRVRPFTIGVLIAGLTNVLCSYAFVRYLHWGLRGIVLGTIVAVVGRCAIWMPWYVLRTLSRGELREQTAL